MYHQNPDEDHLPPVKKLLGGLQKESFEHKTPLMILVDPLRYRDKDKVKIILDGIEEELDKINKDNNENEIDILNDFEYI